MSKEANPKVAADSGKADVAPVVTKNEVQRYRELGLGRGLDVTKRHPWTNKGSFQVRYVEYEDLLGTDQGGILQSYENDVESVKSQQASLKTSIAIPHCPVDIDIDADLSRGATHTRRVTGRKVETCTISFRLGITGEDTSSMPADVFERGRGKSQFPTLEERLSMWIMENHDPQPASHTDVLASFSKFAKETPNIENLLEHDCQNFIREFSATHYIVAITLGALEYRRRLLHQIHFRWKSRCLETSGQCVSFISYIIESFSQNL